MDDVQSMTIADLTGDAVLYRDLQPYDADLPGLTQLREPLGLPPGLLPRKRDAAYARVMGALLAHMRERAAAPPLRMLLVVGDTANDRMLAQHLRASSGLPVYACIGADALSKPPGLTYEGDTATATRWSLLDEWLARLETDGAQPWPQAALLLDIDKTLLGPRGRNDEAIDDARAAAALDAARSLPDFALNEATFEQYYATLCDSEYHGLTLDNQDYTVFAALLLTGEVLSLDELRAQRADGTPRSFGLLLDVVEGRLPPALTETYAAVRAAHEAGDPSPFKAFRRAEFAATLARMGDGRLTLCREVVAAARTLRERGVLCLAASDKPAESALPAPEQEAAGMAPLHRTPAQIA
jgi:hypothetical protein